MTNGTRNVLGIAGQWVAIALMLVGIIWVTATQSGNLDRVVKDVIIVEAAWTEIAEDVTELEKAVILIQSDISHMKEDITDIRTNVKTILDKLE